MFSWYGNPFISQGNGRIKTDAINEARIKTVLDRYQEWSSKNGLNRSEWIVSKTQRDRSKIVFPLAGLAFGLLSSLTFVHQNSHYIGKIFTIFTTGLGYWVYTRYEQSYQASRRFMNFSTYPIDIQRMIENNDARYAFKWLKEDYINNPSGRVQPTPQEEEEQ